ncbi:MAG: 5'-methylthioadenosine/adenosylhomocysteine nucleosidase [Pseudomonadota bacterium]|nr:5'-methylthioadenosine/adenosylhomocysteine nucleosidase [Pseudomonadota bacterium]
MTRIAVVAALEAELGALLRCMPDEVPVMRGGRAFYVGTLDGHEMVAVLSRVGKVAAATTATLLATEFGITRAIFTGTAGGLHEQAKVGDVVVASAVLQHDMDASPLFPRYEVPLYGVDRFHADPELSAALAAAARSVLGGMREARLDDGALDAEMLHAFGIVAPAVHTGLVVSGDRFFANAVDCASLRERLPDALAVEMEGAALGQVCHDLGIAFAVVRTISDRADDSAHVDFARFVESIASRYTLAIVRRFPRGPD